MQVLSDKWRKKRTAINRDAQFFITENSRIIHSYVYHVNYYIHIVLRLKIEYLEKLRIVSHLSYIVFRSLVEFLDDWCEFRLIAQLFIGIKNCYYTPKIISLYENFINGKKNRIDKNQKSYLTLPTFIFSSSKHCEQWKEPIQTHLFECGDEYIKSVSILLLISRAMLSYIFMSFSM